MREIDGFERDLPIERERGRDCVRERDGFEREREMGSRERLRERERWVR